MKYCIIAEKPSVAKDIARVLDVSNQRDGFLEGKDYIITWAYGHLISLCSPEAYGFTSYKKEGLPIIPKKFKLEPRRSKQGKNWVEDPRDIKQLKIISQCFSKADEIIVATDAGREGELIFRQIYTYLECKKPFKRLWISSLTDKSIKEGFQNLKNGEEYDNLYIAAKARSEADWIVGMNASRGLSIGRYGSYSLGRVQTPTLAMICRRFLQNKNFNSIPYWTLNAVLRIGDGESLDVICKDSFENLDTCNRALDIIQKGTSMKVLDYSVKKVSVQAPLLYDLTTLQKDANKQFNFTADKTLSIAQSLYEKKATTYPRTSSRYISEDVFENIPNLLMQLGSNVPESLNRNSVDNNKITDHHAIIPTGEKIQSLSKEEETIYDMIVTRTQEAFSSPAQEERISIEFSYEEYTFQWHASRILSLGWKAVLNNQKQNEAEESEELIISALPKLSVGDSISLVSVERKEHQTKPKPLYTEASLLSAMENVGKEIEDSNLRKAIANCGIGTPATRANIIETLIKRGYIERVRKSLLPTEKGIEVYNIIKDKKIGDAEMTASWEEALAFIEKGSMEVDTFEKGIEIFTVQICNELINAQKESFAHTYNEYVCPICQKKTVGIFPKVIKCKDEKCSFFLFREICGVRLSEQDAMDLIQRGKTKTIKGFKSKAGKSFKAKIVLKEDFSTEFEFEK